MPETHLKKDRFRRQFFFSNFGSQVEANFRTQAVLNELFRYLEPTWANVGHRGPTWGQFDGNIDLKIIEKTYGNL